MARLSAEALTHDAFLGGSLAIWQPVDGYRAGIDPVLLAAAIPAQAGQSVLELGCGVGIASLCLARRVRGLSLVGLELQAGYAELARRNAAENDVDLQVIEGDISVPPKSLLQQNFDHVIANPPYLQRTHGTKSNNDARDIAVAGSAPLSLWVQTAARRLKPGGMASFIQSASRLPELLGSLEQKLGSVVIRPICPRTGRDAKLVIVQARKGGRASARLVAPVILHRGTAHLGDGDDYRADISAVLRAGAALEPVG